MWWCRKAGAKRKGSHQRAKGLVKHDGCCTTRLTCRVADRTRIRHSHSLNRPSIAWVETRVLVELGAERHIESHDGVNEPGRRSCVRIHVRDNNIQIVSSAYSSSSDTRAVMGDLKVCTGACGMRLHSSQRSVLLFRS